VEGGIGITGAVAAGRTVLLGFGIGSLVECLSCAIAIWRLIVEGRGASILIRKGVFLLSGMSQRNRF